MRSPRAPLEGLSVGGRPHSPGIPIFSGLHLTPGTPYPEMAALMRVKDSSRCLLLLAAVLMVESSQLGSSRAKLNSIKSSLGGETPAQSANRSAGMNQGLAFGGSKKGKSLGQVGNPPQTHSSARRGRDQSFCICTLPLSPAKVKALPKPGVALLAIWEGGC